MQLVTCKYSHRSHVIQLFRACPLLCLSLPLLAFLLSPLDALLIFETNSKTELKKGCELILRSLFYY